MYYDDFRWAMGKIVHSKYHIKNKTEPDLSESKTIQHEQTLPSIMESRFRQTNTS